MTIEGKSCLISSNVSDPLGFIPIQLKRKRDFIHIGDETVPTKNFSLLLFHFLEND